MSNISHHPQRGRLAGHRLIILQDVALTLAASLLAILVVRWLSDPIPEYSTRVWHYLAIAFVGILLSGLSTGLWKLEVRRISLNAISRIALTLFVKECVIILGLLFGLVRFPSVMLCFLVVAVDTILSSFLLYFPRYFLITLRKEERAVSSRVGRKTALVAGTGASSVAVARDADRVNGFDVLGFITDSREKSGLVVDDRIVYYCSDWKEVENLQWRLGGVDTILFPPDWRLENDQDKSSVADDHGTAIPQNSQMSLAGYAFKRLFDMGLSGVLLVIFSPVMALCALAIRIEDGSPVIYRQERIGKGGKPFDILKFRSMRLDAEAAGQPALYAGDDDPRLTRVGRFLRQHHLDELPQLWNVVRGDMSFIGYRPERQYYIDQIMERNPRYRYLYQIRPGVTSYATLYNGYTDTIEKMLTRLELDLYYLRNHSVLFDMKVLGLTFLNIVAGKKF